MMLMMINHKMGWEKKEYITARGNKQLKPQNKKEVGMKKLTRIYDLLKEKFHYFDDSVFP